jgi:hypothetical protein
VSAVTPRKRLCLWRRMRPLILTCMLAGCTIPGQVASSNPATSATTFPPVYTSSPEPTPSAVAPSTPTPPDTQTPTPSPTPAPVLRRLTEPGCCVQPAWSPDGSEIWYIDRPSDAEPGGLWAVPAEGGQPRFVTDRLGLVSPDGRLRAYPEAGRTIIETEDGTRWVAPSGGRAVLFSPDSTRIAWQEASSTINFDRRQVELWVANSDGSEPRQLITLPGGGLVDWMPDGQRLLISGRDPGDRESFYAVYDPAQGAYTLLFEAPTLRGALLSPAGGWLAYQVTFSGDPAQDGIWVLPLAGGDPRRLEVYGAYRWRDDDTLLVLPLEPGAGGQRVLAVEAATGAMRALTDPAVTPLRIAGGDWALAPDGRRIVFVSADDRAIWVLELHE